MASSTVFKSSKLEKEYRHERRLRQRFRLGALFEQMIFAAFMVAVVLFGVYLLFDNGRQTVVKDRDQNIRQTEAGAPQAAEPAGDGSAEAAEGEAATGQSGDADSQYFADSSRWSTHIGSGRSSPQEPKKEGPKENRGAAEGAEPGAAAAREVDADSGGNRQAKAAAKKPPAATDTEPAQPRQPETRQAPVAATEEQARPDRQATASSGQAAPDSAAPPARDDQAQDQTHNAAAPKAQQQTAPAPAPAAGTTSAPTQVRRALFTYRIVGGEPTDAITYIDYSATQSGRLYFFTEVSDPDGGRITHQWRHNGEVVMERSFQVRGRLVTDSSSYEIDPDDKGNWRVYVLNDAGEVIKIGSALY